MSSPTEPATATASERGPSGSSLGEFQRMYDFPLDPFQSAACESLEQGRSVLVAAPTGAGKTVVGEFAVHLALASRTRAFYTTPIKALSNQKFADLQRRYGQASVGLLTGDNSINGDAPIVIMTTEVLRNMLYARSSALDDLSHVVMDEVHYLADRSRGAVWEEVLINLPQRVSVAALSATVSNAEEFGRWLGTVRGPTDVIVEEHRPVPLWQHVLVGSHLHDLFVGDVLIDDAAHGAQDSTKIRQQVNPVLLERARQEKRESHPPIGGPGRRRYGQQGGRNQRRRGRGGTERVSRPAMVRRLQRASLLPAIDFIFSRAGCDGAVDQCMAAGIDLTTDQEHRRIRKFAEQACRAIDSEDLQAVGFDDWLHALERGVAAHHAGLVPVFKEVVEKLFQDGLVRCVFATETLALGINMPARSVVLERLVKWNGESHVALTPGEYTQLTGRAGRRGIDIEGHAVVAWSDELDPGSLAGLASTRTYPLKSSFGPSYNMAVNLVSSTGREQAAAVLEASFAQFQAAESVVDLAAEIERNETALVGYREAMDCHLGDFSEFAALREKLRTLEKDEARRKRGERRDRTLGSLRQLRRGDVIVIPHGRRSGPVAVVESCDPQKPEPRIIVVSLDRKERQIWPVDLRAPVTPQARVEVPEGFSARSANDRKLVAEQLRSVARNLPKESSPQHETSATDTEIKNIRDQLREHPCHACDDREAHARWAERYHRLLRRNEKIQRRVDGSTNSITKQFDRICDMLLELDYLEARDDHTRTTPHGDKLARIYGEADLITSESLRRGSWEALAPAELACVCAALVYESRGRDEPVRARLPRGAAEDAIEQLGSDWTRLREMEAKHGLDTIRDLDLGLCWPAYRWTNGVGLDQVLWEAELTAGDFVRWCKQIIDLLGQIIQADPESPIAQAARTAAGMIDRGVVTYSGVHEGG
jgi:ATP-dependent RNA helicase HelY